MDQLRRVEESEEEMTGTEMKEARLKKGLSQERLAAKLGISKNSYAFWEKGIYKPNPENLEKLIEILK